ncbi:hypothetical protein L249_4466 [Ophiocordyceps polyrhachis-furcata BCC 54312]|uniref:Cytochrome b-c1 complex subunit 10 n=1 Tax=Ophiocordyceps polyrhachis-furcata BCC 54312 TaxID=1330021 RepID=A0A367L896_9HYPO|nr:hypothetical protein L249_4466 [Ophiocordyceps polyrhachis-furcata BCC 54312]
MASPITSHAANFKSAYGPKYQHQANIHGWNKTALMRIGIRAGMYGGAAGVAALLFVSGIPRVRTDIMERIPFVGHFFVKEPANPADNPF